MSDRLPVETFPPGEFIRDEIEARGWTQEVLAAVIGKSLKLVNEVVVGKRAITPETARALGEAFGTSAELWMNLEGAYQLSRTRPADNAISRRANLYGRWPVKDMVKRGWIEASDNPEVLEKRLLGFFEMENLEEEPKAFPHAARKTSYESVTPAQLVWLFRAKKLASAVSVSTFSEARLRDCFERLRSLLHSPEETRHVARTLAEAGIRFVVLEQLPGTKTDGAMFWLDAKSPAIVLSMRYDRIDNFWHAILHELIHLKYKDAKFIVDEGILDAKLPGAPELPEIERRAQEEAAAFLLNQAELDDFIARLHPLYSKERIARFSKSVNVHPGLVVGQLQHRGRIPFSHSREMLVKVRTIVTQSTLTDGWGHAPPGL